MPKCSLLYSHVCAVLPGYYKPCCQYTKYNDIYQDIEVTEMSHKEYTQTPQYQQIRKDMESGWHKGCEKCRLDETQNGIPSLRQASNKRYTDIEKIQFVEISLSNNCNLSCKICNPWSSSKWSALYENNPEIQQFFSNNPVNISIEKVFANVDLSKLTKVKYLGGEPFITPQTKTLFNFLEDNNIMQNIALTTNTNCTFYPRKWITQLLKFKKVVIGLSIDGFDKSSTYSRTGSTWKETCKIVEKWVELANNNANIYIYISTTVNNLTVQDYSHLKKYAKKLGISVTPYVIHQPSYMKLEALPPEYVKQIKDENNKQFLDNVVFDPNLFKEFKKFTKATDVAQCINIKDYIPGLAKYLD
jgi:MoaA/NifB/PqqE/SkfB family radical SAM enzyme